jgi:energy-coupling factor transporter ATP-binding protein EcfA2
MDAARRTECLSGTRKDTLKVIVEWVNNQASEQNILWLHGLAGSGKSTLSTTIASIFRSSSQLGAFIFFNRDVTERSDPTSIIRTLAYQLGSSSANIGGAICAVVERNSNILISPLAYQFDKLILDPLLNATLP